MNARTDPQRTEPVIVGSLADPASTQAVEILDAARAIATKVAVLNAGDRILVPYSLPRYPMNRIKAALFIDFDNIYSGLKEVEERAAQAFATLPGQWLEWLERRWVDRTPAENGEWPPRSILIRNMYLNPRRFGRFRADFTRAGFSVMDCPSLTLQGKSSADIRMVLDIVDTLEHRTQFDEFIIFSGDADFTPLLQRLRAHDRRTAILAVGPAAQAYKSAADSLIDEDEFVEQALRMHIGGDQSRLIERQVLAPGIQAGLPPGHAQPAIGATLPDGDVFNRMAARVRREVEATGRVFAANLPRIFGEFKEFLKVDNWLGYYSLRRLTERIVQCDAHLAIEETENQMWFVRRRAAVQGFAAAPGAAIAPTLAIDALPAEAEVAAVNPTAVGRPNVGDTGAPSPRDLASGTAADSVMPASRGTLTDSTVTDQVDGQPSGLVTLARRVFNVTGAPYLSPDYYSTLFEAISEAVKSAPFQIGTTSVIARETCVGRGCTISRQAIQFVIKGIGFGKHKLGDETVPHEPLALAMAFRDNVRKLCTNAQMVLSGEELALLDTWLVGSLEVETET